LAVVPAKRAVSLGIAQIFWIVLGEKVAVGGQMFWNILIPEHDKPETEE
jgi:hypothetical protein